MVGWYDPNKTTAAVVLYSVAVVAATRQHCRLSPSQNTSRLAGEERSYHVMQTPQTSQAAADTVGQLVRTCKNCIRNKAIV